MITLEYRSGCDLQLNTISVGARGLGCSIQRISLGFSSHHYHVLYKFRTRSAISGVRTHPIKYFIPKD